MRLEELGLTQDDAQERVVKIAARELVAGWSHRDDGKPGYNPGLKASLDKQIIERLEDAVGALTEEVLSRGSATDYLGGLTIQATNGWGEKTGEELTFRELLVRRVDGYMREKLDSLGRDIAECRRQGRSFSAETTRAEYAVKAQITGEVKAAMDAALVDAHGSISGQIADAVRASLDDILAKLRK